MKTALLLPLGLVLLVVVWNNVKACTDSSQCQATECCRYDNNNGAQNGANNRANNGANNAAYNGQANTAQANNGNASNNGTCQPLGTAEATCMVNATRVGISLICPCGATLRCQRTNQLTTFGRCTREQPAQ